MWDGLLDDEDLDSKFNELDTLAQKLGLDENMSIEDLTTEHIEQFMQVAEVTVDSLVETCKFERERGGVDANGLYNNPGLRENDILLSRLGYAFDSQQNRYVKRDLDQITIPELSEIGKTVLARRNEDATIRGADDLSCVNLVERVFNYNEPVLPESLITVNMADENQLKEVLLKYIPTSKQIRLLGFDHRVDTLGEVQYSYVTAAKNGAKLKIVYHPEHRAFGLHNKEVQAQYKVFIELISKLPNREMYQIQPINRQFDVPVQGNSPIVSMGVGQSNLLHYAMKVLDDKVLTVTYHYSGSEKGPFTQIIEKPYGIPGVVEGFHKVFDRFFDKDREAPFKLGPQPFQVTMVPGDGYASTVNQNTKQIVEVSPKIITR